MPIKDSAKKALRQSLKRAERNLNIKETINYLRRMQRKAIEAGDFKKAEEMMKDLIQKIDRASQKKVLKMNTAARIKSRLYARLKLAAAAPKKEETPKKKAAAKKTAKKAEKKTEEKVEEKTEEKK